MSVSSALEECASGLAQAGIETPRREAEFLLLLVLGVDRAALWSHPERRLTPAQGQRLQELCRRRGAGEPSAYLAGRREFWSLSFLVDARVLVPRPETEHLVEALLDLCPHSSGWVADVGTGSGCVALALAHERPGWSLIGIDPDPGALQVAVTNARRLDLAARFHPLQGRALDAVSGGGALMAVASNPPYIPGERLASLPAEVGQHEPLDALTPGPDGLEVTREVIRGAAGSLAAGGCLALEIDSESVNRVTRLLDGPAWEGTAIRPDLAGKPRVVTSRRRQR